MNTKNYTSNYEYIKNCSIEELAEMMATLTATMYQNLTGRDIDEKSIELNILVAKEWLKEPVIKGDYQSIL